MSGQRRNFYGYMDPYVKDRLRLGNIVWDYKNPDTPRSCIRQANHDCFESEEWISKDPREDCRVKISHHGKFSFVGAAEPILTIVLARFAEYHVEIEAKKMRRIEIVSEKQNEMVQKVINSEPGHGWLHANLTAAYTVLKKGQRFFRRPRIWILTGIYVADNPHWKKVRNHGWNAQARGGAPADLSGTTSVQAGVDRGSGEDVEEEWTMPGERVWACKWLLLKFDFDPIKMTEAAAEATPFHIQITRRYVHGSLRSGDDLSFARLEIAGSETVDRVEDDNSEEDEMSEEDWIDFDKCKEEAEIEYEE